MVKVPETEMLFEIPDRVFFEKSTDAIPIDSLFYNGCTPACVWAR